MNVKPVIKDCLPSPKPWLGSKDLMKTSFQKISEFETDVTAHFGIFIDDERVVISNENEQSLKVYDTSIINGKLVCTHKCDDTPFNMCYAYGMDKIYVACGKFVVLYEITSRGLEFTELKKIPVKGNVIGIAKTLNGYSTANDSSASFRWDDFSIKSNVPYAKEGDKPFICSSFCGKKVAYVRKRSVIVTDTEGNELSESVCSGYPRGLSFDSDDNIIVCCYNAQIEQITNVGKSCRKIDLTHRSTTPYNIVYHPEGHKLIGFYLSKYICVYQIM